MPRTLAIALVALPGVFVLTLYSAGAVSTHFPNSVAVPWSMVALLFTAAMLMAVGGLVHLVAHWHRPLHKLRRELELIRGGTASIEVLSDIRGGIEPLVPAIQALLRDLRRQRAEVTHLEHEMRQRIASRTSALERLVGSLRQQATHDPLTGLHNRRLLDQCLPQLNERLGNGSEPLCLLMIDIDYFKYLNDHLGHGAGDEFLRTVGQLIRSTIREHDLAFRYGGDEFVIILPDSGRATGQTLAERLISLVDAAARTLHLTPAPRLSIGLASTVEHPHLSAEALLKQADTALYAVKAQRHAADAQTPHPALSIRAAG
jgi:diguanylate cyclase (GGDEF)-like protein